MRLRRNSFFVMLVCFVFNFYILFSICVNPKEIPRTEIIKSSDFIKNTPVDYLFTMSEVNSSKITDTSITIFSENFDLEFLDNAKSFKSIYGYDVSYSDGNLTISGLIPDFLYDSLYVEAVSNGGEKYILQIKDFKTAKSQDPLKQFITTTLQYTLKKAISPIDFYMWEHKILMKEVTPEEFVLRVLQNPQILYNIDSRENLIQKMYSAIFLENLELNELNNWLKKFDKYKQEYFLRDEEVYRLIVQDMVNTDDFKTRVQSLNIDEIEVPSSTRYTEVYEKFKYDNKEYKEFELDKYLYVMDYDELNRTEVGHNYAVLFLNEGFTDKLYNNTKISCSIDGVTCEYENGKFKIEGLKPNTIYKNFILTYPYKGNMKSIFVQRIKTPVNGYEDVSVSVVSGDYNILKHFKITIDEFLRDIYRLRYNEDLHDDNMLNAKILFVAGEDGARKINNLTYGSDCIEDMAYLILNFYNIIFGRLPDNDGLLHWINKFEIYKNQTGNNKYSAMKVIEEITLSSEFESRFNSRVIQNIVKINNQNKRLDFEPPSFN